MRDTGRIGRTSESLRPRRSERRTSGGKPERENVRESDHERESERERCDE